MKGAPWFPFYPSDFIGGTTFMTASEVGCYVRLLAIQWESGGIPNDPAQIERVTGATFTPSVSAKFKTGKDGLLRNPRLEEERKTTLARSESAQKSAAKRWGAKSKSKNANALRTHNDGICETDAAQQCERNANHNHNHTSTNVDGDAALKLDGVPEFPTKSGPFTVTVALAEDLQRRLEILTAPEMMTQFHKAHYWLTADSKRLKTARGMPLFFFNWMSRTVEEKEKKAKEARA